MPKLAISGGKPVKKTPFPLWPIWDEREQESILEVLQSGKWGHTMSPDDRAREFEQKFADYHGVDYCVTVANGSVALEVALRTAGVGPGDEVITTPTTFVATGQSAVMVGADTVFADIKPDTYCIDPEKVEEAITSKTKAIIVVHVGGYPCEMNRIVDIAGRNNLIVIEDCAQAHGTRINGRPVGSIGDFGCFSFESSKLMTAGEGGAVTTNNEKFGNEAFSLCNAGFKYGNKASFDRSGKVVGWNLRITEFQAAILTCQLSRLDEHKEIRQDNAAYLTSMLSAIEGITPLAPTKEQNYYSYLFKCDTGAFGDVPVQKIRKAFATEGIPSFSSPSNQPPSYRSPRFLSPRNDYRDVYCPEAEKAFEQEALGISATRCLLGSRQDMNDITETILKIQQNTDELRSS